MLFSSPISAFKPPSRRPPRSNFSSTGSNRPKIDNYSQLPRSTCPIRNKSQIKATEEASSMSASDLIKMTKPMLSVGVGIIGPGLIGSALIAQINKQAATLRGLLKAGIIVVGVCNSKKMLVVEDGLDSDSWKKDLESKGVAPDLQQFAEQLLKSGHSCCVLVDCTASDAVPNMYLHYIRMGIHVVAPNKKFGSGPLDRYKALKPLSLEAGRHFMYEATVGAGLPIMSSLRGLIETGDQILKVEGILSGTLSYIFNTYSSGMKFSDVVLGAKASGYTEPDPRDDLSGTDVARKTVILARECGLDVELADMSVESLVPAALADPSLSIEQYCQGLPDHDSDIAARATNAAANGEVIRYVGTVDMVAKKCSVSLVNCPKDHPFAQLSGTDNMVVFTTERYKSNPLVIKGPGAGAEVTAAGVFSDIIQVIRCHGAPTEV